MSETVKLIIEIPKEIYESRYGDECDEKDCLIIDTFTHAIANGIPLDSVKSKIETDLSWEMYDEYGNETALHKSLMDILDSVGKEKWYESKEVRIEIGDNEIAVYNVDYGKAKALRKILESYFSHIENWDGFRIRDEE